jgi:hypothetical protein
MSRPVAHPLLGKWRIVAADPGIREYLDLVAPACITFGEDRRGEFASPVTSSTAC